MHLVEQEELTARDDIHLNGVPAGTPLPFGEILLLPLLEAPTNRTALLSALHATDGSLCWQKTFEHATISGMVSGAPDLIIVALTSTDLLRGAGAVLALDVEGQERWHWTADVQRVSAPAVVGETVYLTVDTHTLVMLDLAKGVEHDRVALDASASRAAPRVLDAEVYIPCRGPQLLALDPSGRVRWRFDLEAHEQTWLDRTPLVLGERLFTVTNHGQVLALTRREGELEWCVDVGPPGKPLTAPATDGERLYVGARDGVHALHLDDGRELWHFPTERQVDPQATPLVTAEWVYATSHDHHLYVLAAATGQEVGRYAVARRIEVSPVLLPWGDPAQACLAVADRGGTLTVVARPSTAAEHEGAGRCLEAARLRELQGEHAHAAELYERAGEWPAAARLWCALGRPLRQAEALESYARSLEEASSAVQERAAAWEVAAQAFAVEGDVEREAHCRREVIRALGLPIITLDVELDRGLVLEAWSQLHFVVRNEGFGPACALVVQAEGERFEGTVMQTRKIATLRAGQTRVERVDARPLEYGEAVPLRVRVEYADSAGDLHTYAHTIHLPVARREGAQHEGQTINVFVAGGGAAAVGAGAIAAGARGVAVQGDVGGDVVTGNEHLGKPVPAAPSRQKERNGPTTSRSTTAALRQHLRRLDAVELETLCLDHFPEVYNKFGRGMRRDEKINLLLDHCRRHPEDADRLAELL